MTDKSDIHIIFSQHSHSLLAQSNAYAKKNFPRAWSKDFDLWNTCLLFLFSHLPVLLDAFSSIANNPMALLYLQTPKAGPVGVIK